MHVSQNYRLWDKIINAPYAGIDDDLGTIINYRGGGGGGGLVEMKN